MVPKITYSEGCASCWLGGLQLEVLDKGIAIKHWEGFGPHWKGRIVVVQPSCKKTGTGLVLNFSTVFSIWILKLEELYYSCVSMDLS